MKWSVQSIELRLIILLLISSFAGFSKVPPHAALTNEKTIYFFSGLGADSTIFANLKLTGYHKVYINWIPAQPNETLPHYAERIRSQITVENPYIIGVSFGGMVAVEVSKQIEVDKMILISSARTKDELNRFQAFFMRLGMYRIVPGALLRHTNFLMYNYFGAHTPKDKKALAKLLKGTDITFFRWALKSIACWDNTVIPQRTIQIHGTADKIIACRLVHPDYRIKGGGHLMVYSKADTISKIIMKYFKEPYIAPQPEAGIQSVSELK